MNTSRKKYPKETPNMRKRRKQPVSTYALHLVYGFFSINAGMILNIAVWVTSSFDCGGIWHLIARLMLAFWLGAMVHDLTTNKENT